MRPRVGTPDALAVGRARRERAEAEERAAAGQRAESQPDRTVSTPPDNLADANRLRWVAHYAQRGWHPGRIRQALERHLPASQWVSDEQVEHDLKRLLRQYRDEALGDTATVFARLVARLNGIAETALDEYHASVVPRKIRISRDEEMTVPASSPADRTALLNTALRATAALNQLHFGPRGGVTINVDNRQQTVTLSPEAEQSIALRGQVAEMRRLLAEDDQPRQRRLAPSRPVIEPEVIDGDFQDELEAVTRGQGARGSFRPKDQWDSEEDD